MIVSNDYKQIAKFIESAKNIVSKQKAVCLNETGESPVTKLNGRPVSDEILNVITDVPSSIGHIDIMQTDCITLSYKLSEQPLLIDRFVMLGFDGGVEYSMRQFDLYVSQDDNTFDSKNLFYSYKCDKTFTPGSRSTCDVMLTFDEPVSAKTVGIKFTEQNPTDDCIRLAYIGVYSAYFDKTRGFLEKHFGKNLLKSDEINLTEKDASILTDGVVFDKNYVLMNNTKFNITCENRFDSAIFYAVYNCKNARLYLNDDLLSESLGYGNYAVKKTVSGSDFTLRADGEIQLYEIGIYMDNLQITVTDQVITEDFRGIGACVIPSLLMENSLEKGFNRAYWEKEKSRVNLVKPTLVRLWFQPDWFIIDKESYYQHKYDFNSANMQAVYEYLDLYQKIGTEVEVNFGWKVAEENQDWFSIKDVRRRQESAPADLDEFAVACAEFLNEMIVNRGYTNIKYITFYNEPCARSRSKGDWIADFLVEPPTDEPLSENEIAFEKFNYWLKMAVKAKNAIAQKGLADKVQVWGVEAAGSDELMAKWMSEFEKQENNPIDVFTIHRYASTDTDIEKLMKRIREATNAPVVATEFAAKGKSWDISNTQMAMSYIKTAPAVPCCGYCPVYCCLIR